MPSASTRPFCALVLVLLTASVMGCSSRRPETRSENVPSGWPVARDEAVVTSAFGARRGGSTHEGIDLAAPTGSAVHATAAGEVVFAGRSGRFGQLVVVDHGGGYETRYAHLKRIAVKPGRHVRGGDRVGTVGKSGNATGHHLHYEVRHKGVPVDPRPYLGP